MQPGAQWELWSFDYFDRDAEPGVDARGEGLEQGLAALWRKTLDEGLFDDGRPTLTWFRLRQPGRNVDLPRDPLRNPALARLRRWRAEPGFIEAVARAHLLRPTEDGARALLDAAGNAPDCPAFLALLAPLTR